jgi:hypothetical protein
VKRYNNRVAADLRKYLVYSRDFCKPLNATVGLLELLVGKLVEFIGEIEFELDTLSDRKMKRFVRAVSLRS